MDKLSRHARYGRTAKGKARNKKYRDSHDGQIMRHIWFTSAEFRLWNRLRMQEQRSGQA